MFSCRHNFKLYEANISPAWTTPLQIIDVGKTALDERIFEEYLAEMSDHYTADKVRFLLSYRGSCF